MTPLKRLAVLAVALAAPLGFLAFSTTPANAVTADICASQPYGLGWFKTDDHWDPNRCGNPPFITDNVITLTSWYDVPLGGTMDICADQPLPAGEWTVLGSHWDPTRCGQPPFIVNNVVTVQRAALGTPVINTGGVVSFASDGHFHSGTVVAIYGIDFYAPDFVTIVPQGASSTAATLLYDNADRRGQIDAQLPSLPPGPAMLFVTNQAKRQSAGYPISIAP